MTHSHEPHNISHIVPRTRSLRAWQSRMTVEWQIWQTHNHMLTNHTTHHTLFHAPGVFKHGSREWQWSNRDGVPATCSFPLKHRHKGTAALDTSEPAHEVNLELAQKTPGHCFAFDTSEPAHEVIVELAQKTPGHCFAFDTSKSTHEVKLDLAQTPKHCFAFDTSEFAHNGVGWCYVGHTVPLPSQKCVCVRVCMCVYVCVCMHVRVCMCVYVCM